MKLYKILLLHVVIINIKHIEVTAVTVNQNQERETSLIATNATSILDEIFYALMNSLSLMRTQQQRRKQQHIAIASHLCNLTEKWVLDPDFVCPGRIACMLGKGLKLYWQDTNNTKTASRISELVETIENHDAIRGTIVDRFLEAFRMGLGDGVVSTCEFWECNVERLLSNATEYFRDHPKL